MICVVARLARRHQIDDDVSDDLSDGGAEVHFDLSKSKTTKKKKSWRREDPVRCGEKNSLSYNFAIAWHSLERAIPEFARESFELGTFIQDNPLLTALLNDFYADKGLIDVVPWQTIQVHLISLFDPCLTLTLVCSVA